MFPFRWFFLDVCIYFPLYFLFFLMIRISFSFCRANVNSVSVMLQSRKLRLTGNLFTQDIRPMSCQNGSYISSGLTSIFLTSWCCFSKYFPMLESEKSFLILLRNMDICNCECKGLLLIRTRIGRVYAKHLLIE